MTQITVQDGKIVLRDGKVGTGQGCCCGEAGDCCTCLDKRNIVGELRFTIPGAVEAGPDSPPIPEDGFDFFGGMGLYSPAGYVGDYKSPGGGDNFDQFSILWNGVIDPDDCTFSVTLRSACANQGCLDTYADCVFEADPEQGCICSNHPEINDCVDPTECLFICTLYIDRTWTFKLSCEGDQLVIKDAGNGEPTETTAFPEGFPACPIECAVPPKPEFTVTTDGELSCRCCGGCGCCEDDSFLDSEVINGDCVYIKVSQLLLVAGGGSGVTFGAFLLDYGITKKEASPERDCIESAMVYMRSAYQTNILDEACRGTRETRIYIPDCGSQTLIDITSDYDAPAGVFDVVIEDLPWTFPCHCPPDVPPLPRLPVCNPLP